MESTRMDDSTERAPLHSDFSQRDQPDDMMSVEEQILSSWFLTGATESGLGVPSTLEFWAYSA